MAKHAAHFKQVGGIEIIGLGSDFDGIGGKLELSDCSKMPLLAEFKAVQNCSVWCTTQSFFQQSTALVDFVLDLHRIFTENDPADLQFLRKVE